MMVHANISPRKQKQKLPPDVECPPFYLPLKPFNGRYRIVSNLGNGSFGSVSLAKSSQDLLASSKFKIYCNTLLERNGVFKHENYFNKKTGLVAIKTMNKKLNTLNDYSKVKEIRFILAIPYHQNLVQVYEMFIDDVNFKLHIVMECLDQNLYQLMKARKNNFFSQTTLKSILSQILNGIRHIHRNQYFHRDIKPENILVSPSNRFYDQEFINSKNFKYHDSFIVKIADYGLARHIDNKRPYTSYVSTRWYRAPEILLRKNWYSRPVDIWAFGSVAAEVATFRPLFPGADEIEQTWKVLDVLGTPISTNGIGSYFPSYGYWDEAESLCVKLGLKLPIKPCIDISLLLPNPELSSLCDVIKSCLAWNPNTRADVETVCSMPYFRGSCVDDASITPKPLTAHNRTANKVYGKHSNTCNKYELSKAEILAGIPSLRRDQPEEENQNENIDSNSISPDATAVNYSFLNDDIQLSSSGNKVLINDFEPLTPSKVLKPGDIVPNLTRESAVTNDENYNDFNYYNKYNFINEKQFSAQPRTTNMKSINSLSTFNFSESSNNGFNEVNPNIDPSFICHQPQPIAADSRSFELRSDELDGFDEWNKPMGPVHSFINESNVNTESGFDSPLDEELKYHGLTNESLLELYTNDQEVNGVTSNNSFKSNHIPKFTGELLSKFNLRRILPGDSGKYAHSHDSLDSTYN